MAPVLAQVTVEDFDRFWETFTTRGAALREKHGCRGVRVFRDRDDPTLVLNLFDWDRDGIASFMADPEAQPTMRAAGLVAPPAFTYLEQAGELPH